MSTAFTYTTDARVPEAIAWIEARAKQVHRGDLSPIGLDTAAWEFERLHPDWAFNVLDVVGSLPSTEPALRALQRQ